MKNKCYYLLMFLICCVGAVLCTGIMFFGGNLSLILKAAVIILDTAYIFEAADYRRKYSDSLRRQREYERLKKKQQHYYPENSYYPVIRRSA